MRVHEYIRKHLLARSGHDGPLEAARANWSDEFIAWMRARMVAGFFRYKRSIHDAEMRGRYDNVGSAIKRLQAYLKDGDKEHLADAANLCMIEHVTESCHPSPAFRGTDDGEHTRRLR
jgi:hypothetical protein